jgi:hypothetical protein
LATSYHYSINSNKKQTISLSIQIKMCHNIKLFRFFGAVVYNTLNAYLQNIKFTKNTKNIQSNVS